MQLSLSDISDISEASTATNVVDSVVDNVADDNSEEEDDEEDDSGSGRGSPALSQYPSVQTASSGSPPTASLIAAANRAGRAQTPVTPPATPAAAASGDARGPDKCCFTPCVGDDEIFEFTSGCQPPMKVHPACMRQSPLMEYGKPSKKVSGRKHREFFFAENVVYCGRCLPSLIKAWVETTDGNAYLEANRKCLVEKKVIH